MDIAKLEKILASAEVLTRCVTAGLLTPEGKEIILENLKFEVIRYTKSKEKD